MNCLSKVFIFAYRYCLIVLPLLSGCSMPEQSEQNFVAYSWSQPSQTYSNIIPFYWLKTDAMEDMQNFVLDAKRATQAMPEGHKALFSWDLHRSMAYMNHGDFLFTPQGSVAGCNSHNGFKPYRSLWWDNGVAHVQQLFDDFFSHYKQIGGELDVFVLDFEQGFSYWHLVDLVEKEYECGLDDYFYALMNDTRYQDVEKASGIEDLQSLKLWYENDDHLIWAAYTWKHLANYINQAIYVPLEKYFPEADLSNYGYYYQSEGFDFPDIHGYNRHQYTDGIHIGTHQSRELYGWMSLPTGYKLEGVEYPNTAFNSFRFALNKLRAMLLSSDLPVSPWVAYKGFENSQINDNDFYQELIFHSLLSGVDYLLYWNPSQQSDFSPHNDQLFNSLLERVNRLIAGQNVEFMLDGLAGWLDDLLVTKVRLANGSELWRVSANLALDEAIQSTVVQSNPASLRVNQTRYDFDSMRIFDEMQPLSDKGLWLISN